VSAAQLAIKPRADDSSTKSVNKGNHSMTISNLAGHSRATQEIS